MDDMEEGTEDLGFMPVASDGIGPDDTEVMLTTDELRKRLELGSLAGLIREKFQYAADAKVVTEGIALNSWKAYRGEMSQEELANLALIREHNPFASSVFIKITKTKILAAYSQIMDILTAGNKFPIGVEPTPVPEGVADIVHLEPEGGEGDAAIEDVYGYKGDGRELEPGATSKSLLSGLKEKYEKFLSGKKVVEGPAPAPTLATIYPADETARNLDKEFQDQLTETNAFCELNKATFEGILFGTGIIKGPLNISKTIDKWDEVGDGECVYSPEVKELPKFNWVSFWNAYPDPNATEVDNCEFFIERHIFNKFQVRDLLKYRSFDREAIKRVLASPPVYTEQYWEVDLKDNTFGSSDLSKRFELLEYWGFVDIETATALGLDTSDFDEEYVTSVQINAWICGNEVIKLVLNPFTPDNIPYHKFHYEQNPYQFWGVGAAENMADEQLLMNAHARKATDNLHLAGNVVLEVNQDLMSPGQDMTMYAGKIFLTDGGGNSPQVIRPIQTPNVAPAHWQAFDKARQLADEAVGIPSFSHGQTGISGIGRTAGGISMLMGAAASTIKGVVSNIDTMLESMGQALFRWNMQFNSKKLSIKGDISIVATGTKSMMKKEVRTQRLMTAAQVYSSSPLLAPFMNARYYAQEIALSLDLDPDKAVNDPQTAAMYAELIGKQGNGNQQGTSASAQLPPTGGEGTQSPPPGANVQDTQGTGGGTIGTGIAPVPGETSTS